MGPGVPIPDVFLTGVTVSVPVEFSGCQERRANSLSADNFEDEEEYLIDLEDNTEFRS